MSQHDVQKENNYADMMMAQQHQNFQDLKDRTMLFVHTLVLKSIKYSSLSHVWIGTKITPLNKSIFTAPTLMTLNTIKVYLTGNIPALLKSTCF